MSENEKLELAIDNDREWRKLLLDQNKKLFEKVDKLNENFSTYKEKTSSRITKIEVKSGVIGIISAILSSLGFNIWK